MMNEVQGIFALAGLTLLTACGSPMQPRAMTAPAPNAQVAAPPSIRQPAPYLASAQPRGFRIQDRQNYFHLHRSVWVWHNNQWTSFSNPTWWYFRSNDYVYTDMGLGTYGWWWLPHRDNYQGWIYLWSNNRWNNYWAGFEGESPVLRP